tara:strand:+ start:31 stop:879 length:849 start_codon:yes stop_codon:yes gene_type:complete
MHINLEKFFKPFGKGIEMTNKDNNSQTNTSSPIWWLVSAIASVFIGSKLIIGMETVPAVLISLSIFFILGWALQKIFGVNTPVSEEAKDKDKDNRLRIKNKNKSLEKKKRQDEFNKHLKTIESNKLNKKKKALEKKQKQDELNKYLNKIRINKPGYILKAQIEFEREYKSTKNLSDFFGVDRSPLSCFGYVVGKTKGRSAKDRKDILEYSLCAKIPDYFPKNYINDWGDPFTLKRFNKIISHLTALADLRENRKNFEVAVMHWRTDAEWFSKSYYEKVRKFA